MAITLFTQRHSFYDGTFNESHILIVVPGSFFFSFYSVRQRVTYLINFTFVFQVPERLYQLVDRSTDGLVTADQVMEFIAGLQAIRYEKNKLCSVTILRRIATSATHEFPLKRLTAPPHSQKQHIISSQNTIQQKIIDNQF